MFRPMLAAKLTAEDLPKLRFPLIASPKLDGIRVIRHPQLGAVTRKLKKVPNLYVRKMINDAVSAAVDGEIICGEHTPDVFNRTSSAIMSEDGKPDFTYWVFDQIFPGTQYIHRLQYLSKVDFPDFVKVLESALIENLEELEEFEGEYLSRGYEGIMLRSLESPYKFNRSTIREQYLLKLKRFQDADATIIGVEERFTNKNPITRDERGYAKRSSHKANQIPTNTLGAFSCVSDEFPGLEFNVGTGFTDEQRQHLWSMRRSLIGKVIKFKYQRVGVKDAPRFPTFIDFRKD